ncbi:hypothetical protein R6Q57_001643 [Mikania cordata]
MYETKLSCKQIQEQEEDGERRVRLGRRFGGGDALGGRMFAVSAARNGIGGGTVVADDGGFDSGVVAGHDHLSV